MTQRLAPHPVQALSLPTISNRSSTIKAETQVQLAQFLKILLASWGDSFRSCGWFHHNEEGILQQEDQEVTVVDLGTVTQAQIKGNGNKAEAGRNYDDIEHAVQGNLRDPSCEPMALLLQVNCSPGCCTTPLLTGCKIREEELIQKKCTCHARPNPALQPHISVPVPSGIH